MLRIGDVDTRQGKEIRMRKTHGRRIPSLVNNETRKTDVHDCKLRSKVR